jgi:hypothetical protein
VEIVVSDSVLLIVNCTVGWATLLETSEYVIPQTLCLFSAAFILFFLFWFGVFFRSM